MSYRDYFTQHNRWGKLIGAILGFTMAGPLGALFGIFLGNFFDRVFAQYLSKPHWSYRTEHRAAVQTLFLEATFSVMGHIAKADGRVSERAIQMTQTLMDEMELRLAQRKRAQGFFNEGKKNTFWVGTILSQLQAVAHNNPELLKLFIDIQYRIAQVDGLSTNKISVLNQIFNHLGLAPLHNQSRFYDDFASHSRYQQQTHRQQSYSSNHAPSRAVHPGMIAEAYALLALQPSASKDEVKRAYRRLISRNHPDKMMAQGASEQTIKTANAKTQTIRKAYEHICTSRGW